MNLYVLTFDRKKIIFGIINQKKLLFIKGKLY